jgi:hypothetical protein
MAPHNYADCVGNYCVAVLSGEVVTSAACWYSTVWLRVIQVRRSIRWIHWDRLAKNQPAEITTFQISEVQEAPAFNGRRSFLTLRDQQSHTLRATGTDDLGVTPGRGGDANQERSPRAREKNVSPENRPENRPERDAIPVISMHRDAVDDVVEPADSATGSAKKKPAKHGKNRELQGSESGEGGIRTPGASFPAHRISNPAQSATLAPPLAAHPQASYGDVAVTL